MKGGLAVADQALLDLFKGANTGMFHDEKGAMR